MIPDPSPAIGRRLRHGRLVVALLATAALVAGCSGSTGGVPESVAPSATAASASTPASAGALTECPTSQPDALPAGETRTVTVDTDKGAITMQLKADLSPIAVGNFVALASCGYYDGVVFHRVVPGFVIQGGDGEHGRTAGDPLVGTGGPGYSIKDEPVTTTYHRGTVAMARSSQPDSVGSQFFIVLDDAAATSLADPSATTTRSSGKSRPGWRSRTRSRRPRTRRSRRIPSS